MKHFKKLLFGVCLVVGMAMPVMAEMEIPRNHWHGTDDGDDVTWNSDGSYLELKNDTDSSNLFRIEDSSGSTIVGSNVAVNNIADLELGSQSRVLILNRLSTTQRDALDSGQLEIGMIIYNSASHKLNVYTGSAWEEVTSS